MQVTLVRRGPFTVAMPLEPAETLTSEIVEATRKVMRSDRED